MAVIVLGGSACADCGCNDCSGNCGGNCGSCGTTCTIPANPPSGFDDSDYINSLIQAAPFGATICFVFGLTYLLGERVILKSGVSLNLNGSTWKPLSQEIPLDYNMVLGIDTTDFDIYGGVFDVGGTTVPGGSVCTVIGIGGTQNGRWNIRGNSFIGFGPTDWIGVGTVSGFNAKISGNRFEKLSTTNTFAQSINISGAQPGANDFTVSDNIMVGLGLNASCLDLVCTGNIVSGVRYGAGLAGGFAGSARAIFSDNLVHDCPGIDSNGFGVDGIQCFFPGAVIDGNICAFNGGNGITVGGNNSVVNGNFCYGNGTALTAAGISIVFTGAAGYQNGSFSLITGNRCYDPAGSGGTQAYGIADTSGCTGLRYYSNSLVGNKTASQLIASVSPSFIGAAPQGKAAWTPGLIANGASVAAAVTVPCNLGDFVIGSFNLNLTGCSISAYINTANNVIVVITNNTGAGVTLGAGTVRAQILEALA